MPERQLQNLWAPNELGAAQLPAFCRPKASSMLADRAPMEDHAVGRDRFGAARNFKGAHSNIARLANGLVGDARALAGDLTAPTSA